MYCSVMLLKRQAQPIKPAFFLRVRVTTHRVLHSLSTGSEQNSATIHGSVRNRLSTLSRHRFTYHSESGRKRNSSCFDESDTCNFFYPFGSPRTRSPTILRCTSEVPPAMLNPRAPKATRTHLPCSSAYGES